MSHYSEEYTNKISGGSHIEENKGVVFSGGGGASYTPPDPVNNPKHYTGHPSGIECIQISKFHSFCIGNAIKYIWRHEHKNNPIGDLKKAIFYIEEQIKLYEAKK